MFLRSEESAAGAAVPLDTMWRLTLPWYGDRIDPSYRRRTVGEYQEMLTRVGLTSDFWQLS